MSGDDPVAEVANRLAELEDKNERLLADLVTEVERAEKAEAEVKRLRVEAEIRNRAYAEGEKSWRAEVKRLRELLRGEMWRARDAGAKLNEVETEVKRLREAWRAHLNLETHRDETSESGTGHAACRVQAGPGTIVCRYWLAYNEAAANVLLTDPRGM